MKMNIDIWYSKAERLYSKLSQRMQIAILLVAIKQLSKLGFALPVEADWIIAEKLGIEYTYTHKEGDTDCLCDKCMGL